MVTTNSPHLSIIIATYNADKTLEKALNSVLALTYQNWECIIIDGISKDGTLSIINKFENIDNRFSHVSEKDEGLYDAFNKGWKKAKGEWIYYLGADDELTNTGIEQLMKEAYMVESNTAIVSGGVIRIRQDNSERFLMSKDFIGSHQSMVMRRSVLEEMNGFNYKRYSILADYDLFIRIKNNNYRAKNCEAIVAYFHAGGTSEKMRNVLKIMHEKYTILKHDKFCKSPFITTLIDTSKTIIGSIYHKLIRFLKRSFSITHHN